MLLFSTILDINEKLTYEKFFDLIVFWNDNQYYEENMNFRNMKMSIRLERSYSEDVPVMDANSSSPYFITHLIDKGYLKKDNNLEFQRDPTYVNSTSHMAGNK